MSGIASLIGVASGPLAGASVVTTGVLVLALRRRHRYRPSHRPGIRRHDGSGRVWEFDYEAGDGRDFIFAAVPPDMDWTGGDVLENPPLPARHRTSRRAPVASTIEPSESVQVTH